MKRERMTTHTKTEKTNAARLLDKAKIACELVPYAVDEEHLDAVHVAEQLGEAVGTVFKTLVLRGDRTGCFVSFRPIARWTSRRRRRSRETRRRS